MMMSERRFEHVHWTVTQILQQAEEKKKTGNNTMYDVDLNLVN